MEATTQTPPPTPHPLSLPSFPLTSLSLSPYSPCHSVPSPRALSVSFSVLPSYWRVKGMLQFYWLHNRLLIPLLTKNKHTCITTGGLRKSKKAVIMKLEYHGVNMKKDTVWNSKHRFHKNACCSNSQLLIRWNHSSGSSESSLGNCFIFSSFGVCFGIKVKRKRWTMLMLYLSDTGSISSIKQIWRILCFCLFFLSFFVIESSVFRSQIPALKTYFYVVVFLEFNSFPLWLSFCLSTWTL